MRGLLLEVPESLLQERRRNGSDKLDEMWDGVLHMVPPPTEGHQWFGSELYLVLAPLAKAVGLRPYYDGTGFYRTGRLDDYRVPDHVFVRSEQRTERGIEGAALVVEILSPRDETYDKLDWYAARGG